MGLASQALSQLLAYVTLEHEEILWKFPIIFETVRSKNCISNLL